MKLYQSSALMSEFGRTRRRMSGEPKNKDTLSSKGWSENKPHTRADRQDMHGSCFLVPSGKKYPICGKKSSVPDCKGLLAANQRSRLVLSQNPDNADAVWAHSASKEYAKKLGCLWAQNKNEREKRKKKRNSRFG